jgi:hypothetical protein
LPHFLAYNLEGLQITEQYSYIKIIFMSTNLCQLVFSVLTYRLRKERREKIKVIGGRRKVEGEEEGEGGKEEER